MKKTHKNYRVDYSAAIRTLGLRDDEIEALKDTDINEELERQIERENKSELDYPNLYRFSDIMDSSSGSKYRSGNDADEPYMTHDDFMRFIVAETRIGSYGKSSSQNIQTSVRPAAIYNVRRIVTATAGADVDSSYESVLDADGYYVARVESSDTTVGGRAAKVIERWFPNYSVVKPDRKVRRRFASSAAGIAWVMIFALVISLPIFLGVVKSEATSDLNAMKQELSALEQREQELIAEFESSVDLREIENIAVNEYGMIKLNQSTIRVLRLNDLNSIEVFSDSRSDSVVPALLSALGIRTNNE